MKNLLYFGIILMLASCGSNESGKVSISEIDNPKDNLQYYPINY